MAHVTSLNVMTGGVWLPPVFWGFHQTLRTRRPVVALLGGLPLALHILASHPQMWLYTILLLIGYALYETVRRHYPPRAGCLSRQRGGAGVGLAGLLTACGLMLAAPQILPSWELQRLSCARQGQRAGSRPFRCRRCNGSPWPCRASSATA